MAFDPSKGGFSALRGAVSKTHLGFQGRTTKKKKKKKQNASFFVVLMTYMLNLLDIIGYINVC